ncbi:MAG: methyltransferase domain-containing protein [Gemmatimonas sp.]|nr:methyltransferase domain-containing protein [Gemmatimonas sp.]
MTRFHLASPPPDRAWSECPLCGSDAVRHFACAHGRRYGECGTCRLIHLAPEQRLSSAAERTEYATHSNDPADPGYRTFLGRVSIPLMRELAAGAEGLDYGSGPGPALSVMLQEQGFVVATYDPFFAPDEELLSRTYDFITCTETAEHFFHPEREFDRFDRMLRPGGWLAVMTELYIEEPAFEHWRYARERTHVCFYRPDTMSWLGKRYGWSVTNPHRNVFLFRQAEAESRPQQGPA